MTFEVGGIYRHKRMLDLCIKILHLRSGIVEVALVEDYGAGRNRVKVGYTYNIDNEPGHWNEETKKTLFFEKRN